MCLPFLCGGVETDDGAPARHPVQSRPPPEQVSGSAANGVSEPRGAAGGNKFSPQEPEKFETDDGAPGRHPVQSRPPPEQVSSWEANGVSKPPGAAGGNKFSPQEPEKFDTARKEGDKKSEKVKQGAKANPDYRISSTTTDYMRDDSAKKGGQDADARSWINQDQRRPSVDGVGSQANRGRINQDQERRASTNEPIREAVDYRFPRADDIGSLANPISRKDQPRRGAHIY